MPRLAVTSTRALVIHFPVDVWDDADGHTGLLQNTVVYKEIKAYIKQSLTFKWCNFGTVTGAKAGYP